MQTDRQSKSLPLDKEKKTKPMGVVIPGFGHPKFLAEAIISACNQDIDCQLYIVVVDDGCKFPETASTVRDLMQLYPGKLFYFRQKNTRLPGARNAGVKFLLQLDNTIEAIYFLDADNRLAPFSLQAFRKALGDDPSIGWAYPDIGFFGLTWGMNGVDVRETAPTYSVFKHLVANISEAGSLVRTEMFRKGVFFDESMKNGFEDWDYWLTAIGKGFKGVRANHSGFLYRRRSESMLAEARREAEALIGRIRTKHSRLFSKDFIAACEHEEAPAFAVMLTDRNEVYLFSDPLADYKVLSVVEFDRMAIDWLINDQEHFFPTHILTMHHTSWEALRTRRYFSRLLFWKLRNYASGFEYYRTEAGPQFDISFGISVMELSKTATFGLIKSSVLRELIFSDITRERQVFGKPRRNLVVVPELPRNYDREAQKSLSNFFERFGVSSEKDIRNVLLSFLKRHRRFEKPLRSSARQFAGPLAVEVRKKLMSVTFSNIATYEPFVCATPQARRLFIASSAESLVSDQYDAFIKLLDLSEERYDEVMLGLDSDQLELASRRIPVGDYPQISDIYVHRRASIPEEDRIYLERKLKFYFKYESAYETGLVMQNAGMVVLLGDTSYLEVLGEARQNGATGCLWLEEHFFKDVESLDHTVHKALAFEHALSVIVTDSSMIREKLNAYGVPKDKIIRVDQMLRMVLTNNE